MTLLDDALALAARGFHIFPVLPFEGNGRADDGKLPAITDWPRRATRDAAQVRKWWSSRKYNIGISTSHFGDDRALLAIDVDNKKGKNGDEQIFALELEGLPFPASFEQRTPSGGRHIVYLTDTALKQGVDVLGRGIDTRSRGGYIVGPGSTIDGVPYAQINGHSILADAPRWLVDRLGVARDRPLVHNPVEGVDPARAAGRAIEWLKTAPLAVENDSGDITTYKVAAKLKDFGMDAAGAFELLLEFWNPRCSPPWTVDDLVEKVGHAFKYGREAPGSAAPEAVFSAAPAAEQDAAQHPFAKLSNEYAFVKIGAFVLHETTDADGRFATQHLSLAEFHSWFANVPFTAGKQTKPVSQCWMEWHGRRQYEGVVFHPGRDAGPRWYNLWRGFAVEPATCTGHPALASFLEHALANVCGGDRKLCNWLIGYFAHMVQRPWEKPLVALVFRGAKGTGKNALVERIGHLLGGHFLVADDDRYLLSNFNSHIESCLFLVLDEAAWAGDKRAEGRLKGLITGAQHNIERKGREPYRVDNLTRVAIIGNEEWLVPASQDERRFAVFNVNDGRKQDRKFFQDMRVGMEAGGYAHLLRYLLDFDLSTVDVNDAPHNAALIDQKHASLNPVEQWWFSSISQGELLGADLGGAWPLAVATNRFRDAFDRYAKKRNIRSRLPEERGFGRVIRQIAPSLSRKRTRPDNASDAGYSYTNPGLAELRADWENYIGGPVSWEEA